MRHSKWASYTHLLSHLFTHNCWEALTCLSYSPPPVRENMKNIVVCCDGTWCGDVAGTYGNVKVIADQFAGQAVPSCTWAQKVVNGRTSVIRYFPGVGVIEPNGRWIEKALDGTFALSIGKKCIEAYQFIAERYQPGDKIWLFGLSRGAFTVRCVAGMINNCGIVNVGSSALPPGTVVVQLLLAAGAAADASVGGAGAGVAAAAADPVGVRLLVVPEPVPLQQLCKEAYTIYRNQLPGFHPNGPDAERFRLLHSHPRGLEPPVRFMGLLDTVGALGVPKLDPGRHVQYEFYDTHVSSEVQQVFQALSLDDQLAMFTPCHVKPWDTKGVNTHYRSTQFIREEMWFPGAHFDLGRQIFVLDSVVDGGLNEMVLPKFMYTSSLANPPLYKTLDKVRSAMMVDLEPVVIPPTGALVGQNNLQRDGEIPCIWKAAKYAGIGVLKPYYSPVTANNATDRDQQTGMILNKQRFMGAYASFLSDLSTTSKAAWWLGKWPLVGLPAACMAIVLDAGLYVATQQMITDRKVEPGENWNRDPLVPQAHRTLWSDVQHVTNLPNRCYQAMLQRAEAHNS